MLSHSGRSVPASVSRILLVLALTIGLLAMHALFAAPAPVTAGEMGASASATATLPVVSDHPTSLIGDQSGHGAMAASAMQTCTAVVPEFGLPLASPPALISAVEWVELCVRDRAPTDLLLRPANQHTTSVLRI